MTQTVGAPAASVPDVEMVDRVGSWLEWPTEAIPRLYPIAAAGPPPDAFALQTDEEMRALLPQLDAPTASIDEIVSARPSRHTHPEAWWLLERLYHTLIDRDAAHPPPPWPAPLPSGDPFTHYFHLYVFLAAVPNLLRLHARRAVPEHVTWRTLRDVGLQVANYQTRHGRAGFDGAFWVWPHFRGDTYTLGRLQFEAHPSPFGGSSDGSAAAIGVHIPALGPLTPDACDDALAHAVEFFTAHYPETSYRVATCESWLLDEQLCSYLSPTSNIVRFQRRFTPVPGWSREADEDVLRFVFGRLPRSLDELPRRTSLERAVVAHLDAGRHWRFRRGWLSL